MRDICVCLCLGLRKARQLATGATPAQTGVGLLNDRLNSQMVNRLTEVSLVGSLAVWLEVLCLVTMRTVKEQAEPCFSVEWGSLSSLFPPRFVFSFGILVSVTDKNGQPCTTH